jgi:ABC-type polysaccharide/polyol phosphate transport system ATPase subunit
LTAVEVRELSKNYPLSGSQLGRLRHLFGAGKQAPKGGLWALRDVSFSVAKGEAFGIIGANGSGKSTLLQIIAGILRPTSGTVEVNGRLSALLELGSGFSPEFTGRDNVYLNGALLGLSHEEIDARFADIERFAGIGAFITQPIKTYSTGMVLRLAFAVAAHVDPEILIVDEALAVGDIAFRQRCMRKIHDLRAKGATILFVSHETSDVKALCERCVWLQNGVVRALGEADDVVAKYLSATQHREVLQQEAAQQQIEERAEPVSIRGLAEEPELVTGFQSELSGHRYGDSRATIIGGEFADGSGRATCAASPQQPVILRISFRANTHVASPIAGFLFRNHRGENVFGSNTARENYPLPAMSAGEAANIDFHWVFPALAPGHYRISVAVSDGTIEDFKVCDYIEDAIAVEAAADAGSSGRGLYGTTRGYFQIRCAAVTVHRNVGPESSVVVNKGRTVLS